MKKIGLIIALSITLTSHGMNLMKRTFIVNPEKAINIFRTTLQTRQEQINNLKSKNTILNPNAEILFMSKKELESIVNNAKYKSSTIPHAVTNIATSIAAMSATATPLGNISEVFNFFNLGSAQLDPLPAIAFVGAITMWGSNKILKTAARNTKIKV